MNIIVDAVGNVLMYSEDGKPTAGEGQTRVKLTDEQIAAFKVAQGAPNEGLTFDGSAFGAKPLVIAEPVVDKRQAAIDALLAEMAKRLDAPPAVKDYAEELKK